eukprot:CAMPEP_0171122246 /NCGR_PEP_ID=MMETSP0766_2-20121228/104591_1 /TAXON_ID=439317 /ORGANISM="Gambierdiscus australes, Strain CAWD 149" /LENGTH=157 /DNA_ID=CAMNT_0011585079 /DNA_START=484 /DNA_END=958 /DNA_ORIENTATION=-
MCTSGLNGLHDDVVRLRVAKAILRHIGVETSFRLCFEDGQPGGVPRLALGLRQQLLDAVEAPLDQGDLFAWKRVMAPRTIGAQQKHVKVRNDGFHLALLVGHQEAQGIHGLKVSSCQSTGLGSLASRTVWKFMSMKAGSEGLPVLHSPVLAMSGLMM